MCNIIGTFCFVEFQFNKMIRTFYNLSVLFHPVFRPVLIDKSQLGEHKTVRSDVVVHDQIDLCGQQDVRRTAVNVIVRSSCSKPGHTQTDRQTDRQTDIHHLSPPLTSKVIISSISIDINFNMFGLMWFAVGVGDIPVSRYNRDNWDR